MFGFGDLGHYYCIFCCIMGKKKLASITCRNDLGNSDLTTTIMAKPKIGSTHSLSNLRDFDLKLNQIQKNDTFKKTPGNTNPY